MRIVLRLLFTSLLIGVGVGAIQYAHSRGHFLAYGLAGFCISFAITMIVLLMWEGSNLT